jgi:hypothetical protein
LLPLVPLNGAPHLRAPAILGVDEVRRDQENDDVRFLELRSDLVGPSRSRLDLSIKPLHDAADALQGGEMARELVPKLLVDMGIRIEEPLGPSGVVFVRHR